MIALADGFERVVGSIVGMVSSSDTELQATAQQMTTTAQETASQSTPMAAAEEAASNVNTVAAAAEMLGSSVQEIGRQVTGSAELAHVAVGEADQMAALVQARSQNAARIGDMIAAIVKQTNRLALDATIEVEQRRRELSPPKKPTSMHRHSFHIKYKLSFNIYYQNYIFWKPG